MMVDACAVSDLYVNRWPGLEIELDEPLITKDDLAEVVALVPLSVRASSDQMFQRHLPTVVFVRTSLTLGSPRTWKVKL